MGATHSLPCLSVSPLTRGDAGSPASRTGDPRRCLKALDGQAGDANILALRSAKKLAIRLMNDPFQHLSRREREILTVLYRCGQVTVEQLSSELAIPPSHSALRTHLLLLEEKGLVERRSGGRRNIYRPTGDREEVRSSALRHLLRTFFGGSVDEMMSALISDDELADLDRESIARLRRLLRIPEETPEDEESK